MNGVIIPIRIREHVTVYVGPVPAELTLEESEKIARVIKAYAIPVSPLEADPNHQAGNEG